MTFSLIMSLALDTAISNIVWKTLIFFCWISAPGISSQSDEIYDVARLKSGCNYHVHMHQLSMVDFIRFHFNT